MHRLQLLVGVLATALVLACGSPENARAIAERSDSPPVRPPPDRETIFHASDRSGRTRSHVSMQFARPNGESRNVTLVIEDLGAADSATRAEAVLVMREFGPVPPPAIRPNVVSDLSVQLHSPDTFRAVGALRAFAVLCPADGWLAAVEGEMSRLRNPSRLLPARDLLRGRVAAGDSRCPPESAGAAQ